MDDPSLTRLRPSVFGRDFVRQNEFLHTGSTDPSNGRLENRQKKRKKKKLTCAMDEVNLRYNLILILILKSCFSVLKTNTSRGCTRASISFTFLVRIQKFNVSEAAGA